MRRRRSRTKSKKRIIVILLVVAILIGSIILICTLSKNKKGPNKHEEYVDKQVTQVTEVSETVKESTVATEEMTTEVETTAAVETYPQPKKPKIEENGRIVLEEVKDIDYYIVLLEDEEGNILAQKEIYGTYADMSDFGELEEGKVYCVQVIASGKVAEDSEPSEVSKKFTYEKEKDRTVGKERWYEPDYCYFFENGKKITGEQTIGDSEYYFYPDGKLATNVFLNEYYYDWTGKKVISGWIEISSDSYHTDEEGHLMTGEQTIGGSEYYFYPDGRAAKSTEINGEHYDWTGKKEE